MPGEDGAVKVRENSIWRSVSGERSARSKSQIDGMSDSSGRDKFEVKLGILLLRQKWFIYVITITFLQATR